MCDEDGRRIPYMCGNETSFNQRFRVCDWSYNVDCQDSPNWYSGTFVSTTILKANPTIPSYCSE